MVHMTRWTAPRPLTTTAPPGQRAARRQWHPSLRPDQEQVGWGAATAAALLSSSSAAAAARPHVLPLGGVHPHSSVSGSSPAATAPADRPVRLSLPGNGDDDGGRSGFALAAAHRLTRISLTYNPSLSFPTAGRLVLGGGEAEQTSPSPRQPTLLTQVCGTGLVARLRWWWQLPGDCALSAEQTWLLTTHCLSSRPGC